MLSASEFLSTRTTTNVAMKVSPIPVNSVLSTHYVDVFGGVIRITWAAELKDLQQRASRVQERQQKYHPQIDEF